MSRYRRPKGRPFDVELHTSDPPWYNGNHRRSTPRQRQGLRYEAYVVLEFLRRYDNFLPKPWLSYRDSTLRRYWVQPDGLLLDPWLSTIIIVEVKYQHVPEAYEQLFKIYAPLIRFLFPAWLIEHVEVCQWFDPAVVCPERAELCQFPDRPKSGQFNVHIWRP